MTALRACPPLYGLVLAGGRGTRLGRDKGTVEYHGLPQARWAHALVAGLVERAFVAVRPDQAAQAPYCDLPLIVDDAGAGEGPAAGLATALTRCAGVAWLVVAADMPLLTRHTLATLVAARDPTGLATAFRHADGTPEPLCAVYEPAALTAIEAAAVGGAGVSLRRLLVGGPAKLVALADDAPLLSVNRPDDDARVRRRLAAAQG